MQPTGQGRTRRRGGTSLRLISELAGTLPCVRCRYDLRGLSITAVCPECGTPVRATLLAVVDPRAAELQPIHRPRLTGLGVVVWGGAAFLAAVCGWAVWLMEVLPSGSGTGYLPALRYLTVGLTALSAAGALAFVNPHPNISSQRRHRTLLAVLLYLPLTALVGWLVLGDWHVEAVGGLGQWAATSDGKSALDMAASLVTIVILLLLRPNARLLASRSILLREGRVDRQHLLALASVLGISVVGEAVTLIGLTVQAGETFVLIGQMLVMVAHVLFTLGLLGVLIDCWRIREVVLQPPLSFESLFEPPPGGSPTS